MTGIMLPQFTHSKEVTTNVHIFDKPGGTVYDLILGSFFRRSLG